MTDEYLGCISNAIDCVKRVLEECGDEYTVIVTADHCGHGRSHGTDLDEDMTIPMFFMGENFEAARQFTDVSILDLTPTIAELLGISRAVEWEGKSLI